MSNATTTTTTATATSNDSYETRLNHKGICLYCPMCHENKAVIRVCLAAPNEFYCQECEEEFTAEDVQQVIENAQRWTKALNWLTTMPDLD